MKTNIQIQCIDQVLTITNEPIVASGGVNEDTVTFDFCPLWDGLVKTAVFFADRKPEDIYEVVLSEDSCVIPHEVLSDEGVLNIGVRGSNDDVVIRTTHIVKYKIVKGAPRGTNVPEEPTPDIYQQILEIMTDAQECAENAEDRANDAATSASNAEKSAENAERNANEAASSAQAAETSAGNAANSANAAVTTANEAKTAATNAVNTANTASTTAAEAKTAATGAQTAASEAKTAAQNVTTAATAAQDTANAAQSTANAAQDTANGAKTIAEAAKTLANGATKVQTGTFQGTESSTANNTTPNSLTFNFPPKVIFIGAQKANSLWAAGWICPAIGIGIVFGNGGSDTGSKKVIDKVTISENTVSWTYTGTQYQGLYEFNWEDHTYRYVAFG